MSNIATAFLNKNINTKSLFFDVLITRAEKNPDGKAFTFLDNGEKSSFTYSELDLKIRRLAAYLQQKNLKGERALLLYPPGFDYIIGYFACLYSGIIAVPVYPPDPTTMEKSLPRLEIIAKDSDAKIALSTNSVIKEITDWQKQSYDINSNKPDSKIIGILNDLFAIEWLSTDTFNEAIEDIWTYPDIRSSDIAYLQYTSGSTGDPKGVMITHRNLIHNTKLIYYGFDINKTEHEGVIWLPIYHDMGLVGGILEPILAGFHCTLLSPVDFLKRPLKWLSLISEINDKPVVSGGPNFAYDLCLKATNPTKREELNLSNWRIAFTGAEPVRTETILQFNEAFKISGFKKEAFYPCYGLAEGTLIVSGGSVNKFPTIVYIDKKELKNNKVVKVANDENAFKIVSCGSHILDSVIRIVDPESKQECSENEIGEIWTMSSSNAVGYWRKKEQSDYTFNAYTIENKQGPFLRTGDLGFILGGELFITGRLKDLIIIRGNNHYPQDIEISVEQSNNLLRPGRVAAFSIDVNDEEQLVIVQEARSKPNVDWDKVCDDIRKAVLSDHSVVPYSIVLIRAKTIMLTSSGKIMRRAARDSYLNSTLDVIHEWNSSKIGSLHSQKTNILEKDAEKIQLPLDEHIIANLIMQKMAEKLKIDPSGINKNLPFTDYGLDSAKSLLLIGELENITNIHLETTVLWNYPTINKLSKFIASEIDTERSTPSQGAIQTEDNFIDRVNELSEEEAEKLLLQKLNSDEFNRLSKDE
ncbi:MAG: AMP-binding protein [Ignavibacteriales bacterium]|nr:AMP-binding protein [Ignavibacteriales bacterium]